MNKETLERGKSLLWTIHQLEVDRDRGLSSFGYVPCCLPGCTVEETTHLNNLYVHFIQQKLDKLQAEFEAL